MRITCKRKFLIPFLLLLVLSCLSVLVAQTTTGTFAGAVFDPTGATVPRAEVTALNVDTGQKYKAVTTDTGDFTIVQVPPGNYEVDVRAKGFKTLLRKNLQLEVNGKITLALKLEVGMLSESVSVSGEASMLRTQDAQVGDIVNSLMVENLPQLDRDPLNLLRLTGDISGSANASNPAGSPGSDVRINGGRMQGMDVLVDGNTVMSGKFHAIYAGATPSMEQVDEFKVITNGIPAEYGRVSGGLVTLATKGGGNAFHGQGFEYFRNQLMNANSWEQNWQSPYVPGQKAPRLGFHQNDYGGDISGPVLLPKLYKGTNKTFFFFNFEGMKLRQAGHTELGMSATQDERNGNMTNLVADGAHALMYDPLSPETIESVPGCPVAGGCAVKTTLMPGNGTLIPASRIDPLAKLIDGMMPLPNRTPTPGWSQQDAYVGFQSSYTNDARWETRLDHNFTDNSRLTLRFNRDNFTQGNSTWYDALNPGNLQIRPGANQGSVGWTWTISPTMIVEARGSVMHNPNTSSYAFPTGEGNWPIDPLMEGLTQDQPGMLGYRVWSSNGPGWGDNPAVQGQDVESLDAQTTYNAVVAVTKVWKQHTFKAGFETRRMYDNHWELLGNEVDYQGSATVQSNDNRWDETIWSSWPMGNAGFADSWGDWLLGMPSTAHQGSVLVLTNAQNYYGSYIQDDFKVNKKLTLNLGLRWDMETPLTDRHNDLYGWDPNAPSAYTLPSGYSWTGALQGAGLSAAQIAQVPVPSWVTNGGFPSGTACYAGTQQCPGNTMFKYHPWQFAPRLAGAYQLDSKTVLRASWGLMYLTATGDYWNSWVADEANAATPYPPDRANGVTGTQIHTNQSMFTSSQYTPFDRSNSGLNYSIGNFYEQAGTDVNMRPPKEQNWNVQVQRQIPWNVLLEVGYNGNHSGDLLANGPISPFPANLVDPKYGTLMQTQVANPLAGQEQAINQYSGATVPLGTLMLSNPAFGGLLLYGQNIGRANYNAGTIKLQKRMSQGVTFLLTYTYSKSLDDVGTAAEGGVNGVTPGSKSYQSYQTIANLYGYSPMDMTHRLTFYHDYQFPFGHGRKFLGTPRSAGSKILDGVVGGWEYAGIWIYHSGTPLMFSTSTNSISTTQGIPVLFGSITTNNLTPSNYTNDNALLTSGQVNLGDGMTNLGSATIRRFNTADFLPPQAMTPGNFPAVFPWIRNPGANSYDASLMKNFSMAREGKVYLQFRAEAQNVLNIRGLGPINTTYGNGNFGLITSSGQDPRNMQISARLFF